jgi:hypothetical protein
MKNAGISGYPQNNPTREIWRGPACVGITSACLRRHFSPGGASAEPSPEGPRPAAGTRGGAAASTSGEAIDRVETAAIGLLD